MPLSEDEQRVIDALERQFADVRSRSASPDPVVSELSPAVGAGLVLLGLAVVVVAFAVPDYAAVIVGLVGATVVIAGMLLLVDPGVRLVAEFFASVMDRLEDRPDRTPSRRADPDKPDL